MLRRHSVNVLHQLHDKAQWRGMDEIDGAYTDAAHFNFSGYIGRTGHLGQAIAAFDVYDIVADELCTPVNQAKREV
jgi:hypothetical protein